MAVQNQEEIKKLLKDTLISLIHRQNDEAKHNVKEVIQTKSQEIMKKFMGTE